MIGFRFTPRIRRLATAALAIATIALAARPGRAQSSMDDQTWRHSDNGRTFSMSVRGKVWYTDDDKDFARIEPDGRVMIEEQLRGGPARMIIVTPAPNGGVQRVYLVDGQTRPYDAEAQSWLAGLLPKIARESTAGAVERARRIYAKSGTAGVLDEVEQISSNAVRRIYLTTLLADARLSPSDAARSLRATGQMSSSSEKANLLVAMSDKVQMSDA